MSDNCFIFGFGYAAAHFAKELAKLGFVIVGTTGHPNKYALNNHRDIKLIDFYSKDIEKYLSKSTYILVSIPPEASVGDPVLSHYAMMIKHYAKSIKWIGYLSSTGVYGDHQGMWVDEESICKPKSSSGIRRLEAEQAWLLFAKENKLPLHIFRLSGIYGIGRNALLRIRLGKKFSIFKENQVFSRIHVDDIVSVLIASLNKINPLSIYNISDDNPEAAHIVDAYAASLLEMQPLPLVRIEDVSLSPMEHEFYASNRRVSNLKIKNELNVVLQYPSYVEGLAQIWREDFEQK